MSTAVLSVHSIRKCARRQRTYIVAYLCVENDIKSKLLPHESILHVHSEHDNTGTSCNNTSTNNNTSTTNNTSITNNTSTTDNTSTTINNTSKNHNNHNHTQQQHQQQHDVSHIEEGRHHRGTSEGAVLHLPHREDQAICDANDTFRHEKGNNDFSTRNETQNNDFLTQDIKPKMSCQLVEIFVSKFRRKHKIHRNILDQETKLIGQLLSDQQIAQQLTSVQRKFMQLKG